MCYSTELSPTDTGFVSPKSNRVVKGKSNHSVSSVGKVGNVLKPIILEDGMGNETKKEYRWHLNIVDPLD